MFSSIGVFGLALMAGLAAPAAFSQTLSSKAAYGKYLAEEVARCQECHTPRTESRDFDPEKWMKGAVMEFAPLQPIKDWHKTSPDITPAGRLWKNWTEAGLKKYLITGLTPKGTLAGPPMPTYKMKEADAEAIVEYLKTLK